LIVFGIPTFGGTGEVRDSPYLGKKVFAGFEKNYAASAVVISRIKAGPE
jgi:hypothetical protein